MKEKIFYVVNETETERQRGRDIFQMFEVLRDPLEHALPEVLSVFASPEQMNEGFFLFQRYETYMKSKKYKLKGTSPLNSPGTHPFAVIV